jgi:ComF family protein
MPFASGILTYAAQPLCGVCRRNEYHFDRARSYGLYSGPLRAAVLQLKFHGRERWGGKLGALLIHPWRDARESLKESPPILAPVPLHRSRERERGFNQAELLARGLLRELKRSKSGARPRFDSECLRRVKATSPQSGLDRRARLENVRQVFVANAERVRGHDVVLIDDVMTTGATVSACARALKQAGAGQVTALTLARATPQFPDGTTPFGPLGVSGYRVDGDGVTQR